MTRRIILFATMILLAVGLTTSVWAGPQTKKYQVTGPITKVEDGKITVQKGDELWEIVIDKDTKITGEMKVGAKVTVEYQMFATGVTVKEAKAAEAAPK